MPLWSNVLKKVTKILNPVVDAFCTPHLKQLTPSVCGFLAHFSPAECILKLLSLLSSFIRVELHGRTNVYGRAREQHHVFRFRAPTHIYLCGVHGNAADLVWRKTGYISQPWVRTCVALKFTGMIICRCAMCAKGGQISAAPLAQYWLEREVEIEKMSVLQNLLRFEKTSPVLWISFMVDAFPGLSYYILP